MLGVIDTICLAGYLALLAGLAWVAHRRRSFRANEFSLGSGRYGRLTVGISVMVTIFSTVNFLAFSSEVADHGLYVWMVMPAFVLIWRPVTRCAIPWFRKHVRISAYEALESYYGIPVRRVATWVFVSWRLAWTATALVAAGRLLHAMTGWNFFVLLLLLAAVAVFYTAFGGMRAVLWTDLVQFLVLFASLVIAVGIGIHRAGGVNSLITASAQLGLLRPFYPFDVAVLTPDPTVRLTWWSCLIGGSIAFLARYATDQMVVQRYLCARSDQEAAASFRINLFCLIAALLMLTCLGMVLRQTASDDTAIVSPVARFAHFVFTLPAGVPGLLLAGLISSALSSIDSGLHSCVCLACPQLHPRTSPARWTIALGSLTLLAAILLSYGGTLFEIANKIINALGSPLLAMFLLRALKIPLPPWAAATGLAAGTAFSALAWLIVPHLALHYYALLNLLVTMLLCLILKMAGCVRRQDALL